MNDITTSILVQQQVPQFVRDEYHKFISFLEAYYEFLEVERFNDDNTSQMNDLSAKLKRIRNLADIDKSLDLFEDQFFNTFVPLIPRDSEIDKQFLIKNALDLYKSKGSMKSFGLFFHLLYGEDVEIKTPKDNILRASDGRWTVENVLRVSTEIYTTYTGDGSTLEFILAQVSDKSDISVYINDVPQNINSFYVKKEYRRLVFLSPPAPGASISVLYKTFDTTLLHNRKVVGVKSGASTLIERVDTMVSGTDVYYQLYFSHKNLFGTFRNDENVLCDFFDEDGIRIHAKMLIISFIASVDIVKPGTGYKVGDYALVIGPATRQAKVIVNAVEAGTIKDIEIVDEGAGFKVSNNVRAIGHDESSFSATVSVVDASGSVCPNTITFNTDSISSYENVVLSSVNFGFPANGNENINSTLVNSLTFLTVSNLGPVTLINVTTSLATTKLPLYIEPIYNGIDIINIGAIGKILVSNPGTGYQVGDQIVFTNKPGEFTGRGANAYISQVNGSGGITKVTVKEGGEGYFIFPTTTVTSSNGVNGSVYVACLMGGGEALNGLLPVDEFGNRKYAGQIKSLRILDSGFGYEVLPFIDLTSSGNKDAVASIRITKSSDTLPGRWTTSDSLLSNEERRLQGRDYYVNNSYVIKSRLEFFKYKRALLDLIHPAGTNVFSEYDLGAIIDNIVYQNTISVSTLTISGRVNTNSSIYVVGTNTKFNISNTNGVLVPGKVISINNEVRTVNAIISNTVFTVSNSFIYSSNNQQLTILS